MNLLPRIKARLKRRSVQLNTAGLAILGWFSFVDPNAALIIINLMPDSVRDRLPGHWLALISVPIYALALIAFLVKPKASTADE